MTIPGQLEFDGMPEPLKPLPVDEMWIDLDVKVELRVRVNIAGLVAYNRAKPTGRISSQDGTPLDYDAIDVSKNGYGPEDRPSIFLYGMIEEQLDADVYMFGDNHDQKLMWTLHDTLEVDMHPRWNAELQAELDEALRPKYPRPEDA